jgi:hypothetical protein
MSKPLAEQESIPIWCEGCNQQGYIFVDDPERPCFVVCQNCQSETSQVWCSKSGMGGAFVDNLVVRPHHWQCPDCATEYRLPKDFYEEPVALIPENQLQPDALEIIRSRKSNIVKKLQLDYILTPHFRSCVLYLLLLFGPWVLLYMLLDYVSLGERSFNFAVVLLLGTAWILFCTAIMKRMNPK